MAQKKNNNEQQGTLDFALPYEVIEHVASREVLRSHEALKVGRQTAYLDIDYIRVRGTGFEANNSFNPRIKPEGWTMEQWQEELLIAELALDMLQNGQVDPLEGDMTPDGLFHLTDGFRRKLAIEWLLREGHTHYPNKKEIRMVEIMQNPKEWTEEDKLVRALSSNNNLKYKPIEIALKLQLWKKAFKRSNEELANRMGKSRQWVDNMLKLAEEPDSIKNAVASGAITHTAALELKNKVKDEGEREKIVQDAINSGTGLSVAAAQATKSEYADYKERMKAVVDRYGDEVITFSKAEQDIKEIAAKAIETKADEKSSIEFAKKTTMKWLEEKVPGEEKAKYKDWKGMFEHILKLANDPEVSKPEDANRVSFLEAGLADMLTIRNKAVDYFPNEREDILGEYDRIATIIEQLIADVEETDEIPAGTLKVETKAADKVEEQSHKTRATYQEPSPQKAGKDLMAPIDFSQDKALGEMELNEATKLLDKLSTNIGTLPAHLQQYVNDWQGSIRLIQSKISTAVEIIKKAGDTR